MHAWCVRTVQWGFNSWSTSPAHAAVWTHLIKEKPAVGIEFYCRHVRTFAVYCLSARSTWVCKAFTVTPVLCQRQALREQMNMHAELNLCIVGLRSPWWAPSSTVETWLVEIFKHGCACTWRSPVAAALGNWWARPTQLPSSIEWYVNWDGRTRDLKTSLLAVIGSDEPVLVAWQGYTYWPRVGSAVAGRSRSVWCGRSWSRSTVVPRRNNLCCLFLMQF